MVKQITPFFLPSLVLTLSFFFLFFLEVTLILISSSILLMFTAEEEEEEEEAEEEAVEKMMQIASRPMVMDRRWKTNAEIAPNCPRCASPNTKFCYYNNYSLSQPRYFCKGCRRYWTRGGSLRNVPVGGGCRKNRRSKSSARIPPPTNLVSPTVTPSSTTTTTTTNSCTDTVTDASNIDLAVVFAKFFNQSQNSWFDTGHNQVDSNFSLTDSSSSDLVQFPEEQLQAEQQQQQQRQEQSIDMTGCDDLVVAQDFQFIGGYEFGLEFPDPNGYGFQTILSDEFSQATNFWSESNAPATVLPNFSWQTSQIQELESVITPSADHHLMFHSNVLLDNEDCSSFDLSSYGIS